MCFRAARRGNPFRTRPAMKLHHGRGWLLFEGRPLQKGVLSCLFPFKTTKTEVPPTKTNPICRFGPERGFPSLFQPKTPTKKHLRFAGRRRATAGHRLHVSPAESCARFVDGGSQDRTRSENAGCPFAHLPKGPANNRLTFWDLY